MSTEKTFDERLAEAWDEGAKHGTYRMNRGEAVIYDLDNPYRRKPIPEPTVPWALVRFADDSTALRDEGSDDFPWLMSESATWTTWDDVVSTHGAPVAVSLPHWSDEVDGLRARVEAFIADLDKAPDSASARIAGSLQRRLRALLAEGGEA